ncbi:MAG: DNA (cytosine-5-)-methyltransferase [Proteobacteria bacterium]|nr:DNA (cytosine-5-)-methyltransferase [Pseudomonadota bacterium]
MTMRVNSFFTGVGGFDLAFQKNGFSPVFYCENNEFCRSVLKRHWPHLSNADDICTLDVNELPIAEVWTAGFPCQDLSLARTPHGRSGLRGSQSGLFFRFLELLSVHRPPVVLLENVVGLLNSHKGADFATLIMSLTELGYAVAWRVLNARYFGAPQSRPRVFICAWYGSPNMAVNALFEDGPAPVQKNERKGFVTESKCTKSGISVPQTSFCISATSGRHTGLDWARSYVTYPDSVRRLTPLECERLQGFPDNWTIPDKEYVTPIRGIETHRYRAIGNAVCIPVVEWVAKRIASLIGPSSKPNHASKQPLSEHIMLLTEEFAEPKAEVRELTPEIGPVKWKAGGCAFAGQVVHSPASPGPIEPVTSRFIDVVDRRAVHDRYFLSPNAVEGIIRRVDRMGRQLFPPLDATLRKIAARAIAVNTAEIDSKNDVDLPIIVNI